MVQPKPDQLDRLLGLIPHPRHVQLSFISREKLTTMYVSVAVVATKMCVTPIISVSIPRLDLLSLPLPDFQVTVSCPFEHTGVDFARPLYVRGKADVEVWLCFYTQHVVQPMQYISI